MTARTFVLTSVTAKRVKGTLNAALQPANGAAGQTMNVNVAFEVPRN